MIPTMTQTYVGQSIKRPNSPKFLRGEGRYVADISLPGLLHAAFLRSPHAHARIKSIDASAARALSGVHLVLTAFDVDGKIAPMPIGEIHPTMHQKTVPVFPTDRV